MRRKENQFNVRSVKKKIPAEYAEHTESKTQAGEIIEFFK